MTPDAEPIAEIAACIDSYEDGIRALSELHAAIAQVVGEPVRSFASAWADLTRDIGATQVSSVRWLLDV
jgi:hypothetical protein